MSQVKTSDTPVDGRLAMTNFSNEYRLHDHFNLIYLTVIVSTSLYFLYVSTDYSLIGTTKIAQDNHSKDVFLLLFALGFQYFIVDSYMIIKSPTCVMVDPTNEKSHKHQQIVIFHHIVSLAGVITTVLPPNYHMRWYFGILMTVESNCIIQLIRRHSKEGSLVYIIFNFLFYVFWIFYRLILFPILFVLFIWEYNRYSLSVKSYYNYLVLAPLIQGFIVAFGFYWTYELFIKTLRSNISFVPGTADGVGIEKKKI